MRFLITLPDRAYLNYLNNLRLGDRDCKGSEHREIEFHYLTGTRRSTLTCCLVGYLDVPGSSSGFPKCKKSAIVFNATLANGYQSGKFVDHGDLGAMSVCQDMCCQSHACDVAFMAGRRCFSVHCHSQAQCLWMPAKDNKYLLQLSYIASAHSIQNSGKLP